jgi:hypothetical protein
LKSYSEGGHVTQPKIPVHRITGRAGTGKTTQLLDEIEKLLKAGVHPKSIALVTLTNAGADVFRERAINKFNFKNRDTIFFKTLHKICWKLGGFSNDNIFSTEHKNKFLEEYYPHSEDKIIEYDPEKFFISSSDRYKLDNTSRINKMIEIDELLMNLMIDDYDFIKMEGMSGRTLSYKGYFVEGSYWSDKHNKHRLEFSEMRYNIETHEQTVFSENLHEYLTANNLFTFTSSIKHAYNKGLVPPTKYLFFDEFQDFRLQYELCLNWMDANHIKEVWVAGDPAQALYRFAGANASYMVGMPHTDSMLLPRTYRFGEVITTNAKQYLDRMVVNVEGNATPANKRGEVITYYGDEWVDKIKIRNDGVTTLILAATRDWVNDVYPRFSEIAEDGVNIIRIEDTRKIDRVFRMYNTIAALERGDVVEMEDVKYLFNTSNCLPTKMIYTTKKTTLSGTTNEKSEKIVLKRIKSRIRSGKFQFRDSYDKKTFTKDFLTVEWSGLDIMKAIPDMGLFEQAADTFPKYALQHADKRIGTIHKAKGDQAEVIIIFMSVPYPILDQIHNPEVSDDLSRQFYVGTTRPEQKIIEIYGALKYSNGKIAPAPLEVIPKNGDDESQRGIHQN